MTTNAATDLVSGEEVQWMVLEGEEFPRPQSAVRRWKIAGPVGDKFGRVRLDLFCRGVRGR